MKTVLITGGARGIGAACSRLFAEKGCRVAVNYRSSVDDAEALVADLRARGYTTAAFCADCSKAEETDRLFRAVEETFGMPDVLVNNASIALQKLFQDTLPEEWDAVIGNDLTSVYHCIRRALPGMIARKYGSIVNISSIWGQCGGSCEVAYSAAKAGVIGLTKALAKEVGPSGIRVNCVCPGVIDTAMTRIHGKEVLDDLADQTPLCRIGTPDEVARAVVFLAGDEASFITGQVLGVNGGML